MHFELNDHQKEAKKSFRSFVDDEIVPNADRFDVEEKLPKKMIEKLAKEGYLGAILPKDLGGRDLDMVTFGLLMEELGRGCTSVRSLVTVQNMIAQTIHRWGSEYQKRHWLGRLASGEAMAAFALTEPEVGSDARNVKSHAQFSNDTFTINGHKLWITGGQIADVIMVFAQSEGKPCAFLIEKDTPGLRIKPITGMLGARASMLAEISLHDCKVSESSLVGAVGFGFIPLGLQALELGRYCVAWGCVGLGQACLDACLEYTKERRQFGVYIREHQLIQKLITDMIVNIKAARLLSLQASISIGTGDPGRITDTMVAKYFASQMAVQVASDAVQIHGAVGCSGMSSVQRFLRDAKVMEIVEGTSQILQIKIAEYYTQAENI
jgi:alkylation response protein AidB-like acyl-CoA dehydrogenase